MLLAASGSVAAIKLPEIAAALVLFADVRVLLTAAARHFVSDGQLPTAVLPVYGAFPTHLLSGYFSIADPLLRGSHWYPQITGVLSNRYNWSCIVAVLQVIIQSCVYVPRQAV